MSCWKHPSFRLETAWRWVWKQKKERKIFRKIYRKGNRYEWSKAEKTSGTADSGEQSGSAENRGDLWCGCGIYRRRSIRAACKSEEFLDGWYEKGDRICTRVWCESLCDGKYPCPQWWSGGGQNLFWRIERDQAGCSDHCRSRGVRDCKRGVPGDRASHQHAGEQYELRYI